MWLVMAGVDGRLVAGMEQMVAVQLEWDVALPAFTEVMVEKVWSQCLLCSAAAVRNISVRCDCDMIRYDVDGNRD